MLTAKRHNSNLRPMGQGTHWNILFWAAVGQLYLGECFDMFLVVFWNKCCRAICLEDKYRRGPNEGRKVFAAAVLKRKRAIFAGK